MVWPTLRKLILCAPSLGVVYCLLALSHVEADSQDSQIVSMQEGLIGEYPNQGFSPAEQQLFEIPLTLSRSEDVDKVSVEVFTEDADLVRQFDITEFTRENPLKVMWDGKDNEGQVVPDEAYFPVVTVYFKDGSMAQQDSRSQPWGEEVYDFEKNTRNGLVEYTLPETSRLLVRAGIKNGPMLRTIVDWEPRAKGFHAERWNGRDSDSLRNIEMLPGIAYLIIGYRLPREVILAYGNRTLSYKDYRQSKQWPLVKPQSEKKQLERGGRPVRPEYYLPLAQLKSPGFSVDTKNIKGSESKTKFGQFEEVLSLVNIAKEDEFYLDQSQYEISFFVDYHFIAEEEHGYVPFKWRWSPGRYGIKPGTHILTVTVSSYNGQVTVKNVVFTLEDESEN